MVSSSSIPITTRQTGSLILGSVDWTSCSCSTIKLRYSKLTRLKLGQSGNSKGVTQGQEKHGDDHAGGDVLEGEGQTEQQGIDRPVH